VLNESGNLVDLSSFLSLSEKRPSCAADTRHAAKAAPGHPRTQRACAYEAAKIFTRSSSCSPFFYQMKTWACVRLHVRACAWGGFSFMI